MAKVLIRMGAYLLWVASAYSQPSFEKATVTPSEATPSQQMWHIQSWRVDIRGATLADLIANAYQWRVESIVLPEWTRTAKFDISAILPDDVPKERAPELLRTLLEQRFEVKAHKEARAMPAWALVVAEGGVKMKLAPPGARATTGTSAQGMAFVGTLVNAASLVAGPLGGRPLVDRTGLDGLYEGVVQPVGLLAQMNGGAFTQERRDQELLKLGLRLEAITVPTDALVVDNVERMPLAN